MKKCASIFLYALSAIFFGSDSLADIRDTPHNFVRNEKGKRPGDKEICAFCHTPAVTVGGPNSMVPPAWQRSVGADMVFTIYDDIGRLGLGKASVGSQSIACLSCHDSNQATGLGTGMGTGNGSVADGSTEDHPFGVPYRGFLKVNSGVAPLRTSGRSDGGAPFIAAKKMVPDEDFRDASSGTVEGRTVWWVSYSGVTARRGKGDLPLYVRAEEAGERGKGNEKNEKNEKDKNEGGEIPYIECSSCHDPHSVNATFLRVENSASRLCMTCHSK